MTKEATLVERLLASAERLEKHFLWEGDTKLTEAEEMREAATSLASKDATIESSR